MKKTLLGLSLLSALASSAALSAPTANIKVTGDIKPPTCTVNGGDNDILFDYGKISPTIIPSDSNYALGRQSANIEISCDAQTYLTFIASDVYTSNNAPKWGQGIFGLMNKENTSQEIGGFLIIANNINVDGKTAFWGRTGNESWTSNIIVKNVTTGWTTESQTQINESELKLASGKIFSVQLRTGSTDSDPSYGYILSKNKLESEGVDISNGLDYIGEAVLTFNFGV